MELRLLINQVDDHGSHLFRRALVISARRIRRIKRMLCPRMFATAPPTSFKLHFTIVYA